jgi:hypothetical protein
MISLNAKVMGAFGTTQNVDQCRLIKMMKQLLITVEKQIAVLFVLMILLIIYVVFVTNN